MNEHHNDLPTEAVTALNAGRMIEAIKVIRFRKNLGLKEAKDAAELYLRNNPNVKSQFDAAQAESRSGGFIWLIIVVAIAAGLYFFFRSH